MGHYNPIPYNIAQAADPYSEFEYDQGDGVLLWYDGFYRLYHAAKKLYMAGRWTAEGIDPQRQARLWEDLRDALELPEGTARAAGVEG